MVCATDWRCWPRSVQIRALIVAGESEKSMIGGADIKEMARLDQASAEKFITGLRDLCEAVRAFPAPVIARMPGWCLGGGLEVAAACDFRIATHDARFGMPEVRVGISSVIHAALLPRLIGWGRARWLIMTAENIDASTALAWGLIDVMAPPGGLTPQSNTPSRPCSNAARKRCGRKKPCFGNGKNCR